MVPGKKKGMKKLPRRAANWDARVSAGGRADERCTSAPCGSRKTVPRRCGRRRSLALGRVHDLGPVRPSASRLHISRSTSSPFSASQGHTGMGQGPSRRRLSAFALQIRRTGDSPAPGSGSATGHVLRPLAQQDPSAGGLLPRAGLEGMLLQQPSGIEWQRSCPCVCLECSLAESVFHLRPGNGRQIRVTIWVVGLVRQRLLDTGAPGINSAGVAELDLPLACCSLGERRLRRRDLKHTKTGIEERCLAVIRACCKKGV